ncbi:MAG: DUF5673 domain-containing protein [bacterium]|nr:DUF5673 domain-containing protein [bacterium]
MKNFSWQAPEYSYKKKGSDWYWTVGIISAALVVTAIIFGNVLFGVVIAIGAFTLTMFASRKPDIITIEITDKGIAVDKTLYPYQSIESFYLDEDHHHGPRLIIKSKKVIVPLIAMPLASKNPDELRAFLSTHLKEEVFEQGIMQTLFDRLGF